jgi:glyoxylase-like metal-dependent hydrolase (beta-lactamase superfamily II)
LPGGNEPLAPLVWQDLPGAEGARIYPLIRKIDNISSNSYVIATPDVLLIIDPGGLPEQAEQLALVTGECRRVLDRPVFVILTHAHIDHFAGVFAVPAFASPETAVFTVQDTGGAVLERGDARMTQGELLGRTHPPLKVGLHLFPPGWETDMETPVSAAFPNGAMVTITYDRNGPGGMPHARLEFGNGPALEVWHTPGHSPDSICLQIGGLFFIGDILFAANPGVAGMCGWDQEALIRSLGKVISLLGTGGISVVCPGHGRVVSTPDASRSLSAVRIDAQALCNIAELNRDRAAEAAVFAEDCMEQVNELFTIMAGRLYYVSYVMDELGESGIAERMGTLIPADTVDELLGAFSTFADEHHHGRQVSVNLALKAGQVMVKLERSLKKEELGRIIDPTLVDRAGRLLSDYTVMLRGFSPPSELSSCSLVPVIGAIVTGLSVPSCSDDDLLSSADDDAAFTQILLSRIGTRPLLEEVAVFIDTGEQPLQVSVDRDIFSDLVTYILEDLVGTGSGGITIAVRREGQSAVVAIVGTVAAEPAPGQKKTQRFLEGLAQRAGGELSCEEDSGTCTYLIRLDLLAYGA